MQALQVGQQVAAVFSLFSLLPFQHRVEHMGGFVPEYGGGGAGVAVRYGAVGLTGDEGMVDGVAGGVGADGAGSWHVEKIRDAFQSARV